MNYGINNGPFAIPGLEAAISTAYGLAPQNSATLAQNKAKGVMDATQTTYDSSQQKLIDMITAPRAAMPQQMPAMSQKESGIAAIVAALGALGGVRPQFLQQGIQGYTGAREQKAQMDYANQTNAYNAQNDQLSRNIQGQQIQLSGDAQKFAMAKDYFDKAGGDLERAKELYRIDNINAQNRKLDLAEKKEAEKAKRQQAVTMNLLGTPPKSLNEAKANIALATSQGFDLSPQFVQSHLATGRQGTYMEAMKKPPVSVEQAQKQAEAFGFAPGDAEYSALVETGRTLGELKKNMTSAEYQETLNFLREGYSIRDAASMARTMVSQSGQNQRNANTIGGANYRAELSQTGQNTRQGITQNNVNARTIYVREAIAAIAAGQPVPSLQKLGPLSPQELQSIQKEINAWFGDPGNVPATIQPGQITPNGTVPTRRDKTGSTKKNTAKATTAPAKPKQSGPKVSKKGDEVVFDFSGKKK
jgi:hypothetical protein